MDTHRAERREGARVRIAEIEDELERLASASPEVRRALTLEAERRLYRRLLLRTHVRLT